MSSHHHLFRRSFDLLDDPFFPFSSSSPPLHCPLGYGLLSSTTSSSSTLHCPLGFDSSHPLDLDLDLDLDLFHANPNPIPIDVFPPFADPCLLEFDPYIRSLGDRVAALELAVAGRVPRRKYTYTAGNGGRKVKWTAEEKGAGDRSLKWEAEVKSPNEDGFDRKWKWAAEAKGLGGGRKVRWGKEVKGKGWCEPWSHAYSWEEAFEGEEEEEGKNVEKKKKEVKKVKEVKEEKKEKKCPVKVVEIEDNTAGCVAIRKAFARSYGKGKRKELSPQDAALLIQINFRAHLARRSQVLRCLRDLAVAKAKLKEIRTLFYNISYRRRIAHDSEERQRFSEKIIVLLLTVDALEGPDYMVRTAKKSMLEELEAMLEIVDPQPPGKQRSLRRRRFDLPEDGVIPNERIAVVNEVVRIVEDGK